MLEPPVRRWVWRLHSFWYHEQLTDMAVATALRHSFDKSARAVVEIDGAEVFKMIHSDGCALDGAGLPRRSDR